MLCLTLIRHAKSDWSQSGLSDFSRPLNKRGLKNAPMMGRILKSMLPTPDHLISSPALRAITTARLIAAELGYPEKEISSDESLYDASVKTLLGQVQKITPSWKHVVLVAHNPGMTELCNYLSDGNIANLPTCAAAHIEFDVDDWRAVDQDMGQLKFFEYPKKHHH